MYEHWLQRGGDWTGRYNHTSKEYESIDSDNVLSSLHVINAIVDRYKDHPAVVGIEPSKCLHHASFMVQSAEWELFYLRTE